MGELNEELRLTSAQSDTVRAVLQRHWTRMSAVWETVRPRFDTLRAEMDAEVSRHLTPEQQAKYRDHVTRYRQRREQDRTGSSGRKQ
jgi:2'-5' RNA ligase